MNTASQTLCPTPARLAQLVSGSLIETEAERLFQHIDSCSSCQLQVDDLARRKDSVIAVAKNVDNVAVDNVGLSKLIHTAQKKAGADDTQNKRASQTKVISVADFVTGLRKCGLIEGDELNQLLGELSWDEMEQAGDSSSLARALIHQQKLTPFQAKLLLRGRWQGLVLGNYAILDKLGQGGMGAVFKARHIRMGRVVCLKIVNAAGRQSPEIIDRFRNEARALAALSHPNIVVAHDADEAKGIPYLVMEFIDGEDLAKTVRKSGPLGVQDALEVGIQTARALWYAHGQGVIHRDIKPHNLVTTTDEATGDIFVKVLDLGLARFDTLMTDNPDASVLAAMTNTGVVIGTVDYMAPEQALDSRNADARSDTYSLGCTLFFLLAGRAPFSGETVMQRLVAHREQPAPNLGILVDDVSPELNAVIQKMLAKNPSDRYATMDLVLSDLQAIKEGRSPSIPVSEESVTCQSSPIAHGPTVSIGAEANPSPMNIKITDDTSEQRPRGETKLPRLGRRTTLAMGIAATILMIIGAAYALMPSPDSTVVAETPPPIPAPRVGAAQAIRNGGEGRALVLVSSKKFNEDEFISLANTLENRGVNLVVASSKYGTGDKEAGEKIRAPYANVHLRDADPTGFDSVFILGGENRELSHKDQMSHNEVKRIVEGALKNKIVVTGCQSGYHDVLKDTGLIFKEEFKHQSYKFDVCNVNELEVEAGMIFDDLKAKK